jgi:hypothetical protein
MIQSAQNSNDSLMEAAADVRFPENNISKVVYGTYRGPIVVLFLDILTL